MTSAASSGRRPDRPLAFITNFCPYYRKPLYERLAERLDMDFLFFSQGQEGFWNWNLGRESGRRFFYLKGLKGPGGLQFVPDLYRRLFSNRYAGVVKCTNGRLELLAAFLWSQLTRRPFVLWHTYWMTPRTSAARLAAPLVGAIQRRADAIVVIGPHIKNYLVKRGIDERKIFIAWQATENARYARPVPASETAALRDRLSIEPNQRVVLFVGRLTSGKGLDVLIDACAALSDPTVTLLLVGDGDQRSALEDRARAKRLQHLRVHPTVKPDEIASFYALASTLVLPSVPTRTFLEPWGLVVNEAMSAGVPVVTSDAVGAAAAGLVRNDETGLVVPHGDAPALTAVLRRVLNEPGLSARLTAAARKEVASYDYERMAAGFEAAVRHAFGARG